MTSRSRQPLGAGGADVILAHHRQHRASGVSHHSGGERRTEHDRRHDDRFQACPWILERADITAGGQPAEVHRKKHDHHDPEPEIRDRDAGQGGDGDEMIPSSAAPDRREDAGRYADDQRDEHGGQCQMQRHRDFRYQHRPDFLTRPVGHAEVAMHDTGNPAPVLNDERIVESVTFADFRQHGWRCLAAADHQRRIARQQLLETEDDDRDDQKRWYGDQQSLD